MLTTLPVSFDRLMAQREVTSAAKMLTTLPVSFGQLMAQRAVELSSKVLTTLPESLAGSWHSVELSQKQDADHAARALRPAHGKA